MTGGLKLKLDRGAELVDGLNRAGVERAERYKLYREGIPLEDTEALDRLVRSVTRGACRVVETCVGILIV
jgi:hypothetical protein